MKNEEEEKMKIAKKIIRYTVCNNKFELFKKISIINPDKLNFNQAYL